MERKSPSDIGRELCGEGSAQHNLLTTWLCEKEETSEGLGKKNPSNSLHVGVNSDCAAL